MKIRRWINFARWSNRDNCIGKGKMLDCEHDVEEQTQRDSALEEGKMFRFSEQ